MRLLVGISIAGTMVATASPHIGQTMRVYSLRGAALEVFAELQNARLAAVTQNNPFRFTLQDSTHYAIHDDSNRDGVEDAGEVIVKDIHANSPTVSLAVSGAIEFAPNGIASGPGTITVTNSFGDTMRVTVSRAGRIRIE